MELDLSWFTLFRNITLLVMTATIWVAYARFHSRLDSTWPLLYYTVLMLYWRNVDGSFDSYWMYVGLISALLLRFEFLGGLPLKFIRAAEVVFFGYIVWRFLGLLLTQ